MTASRSSVITVAVADDDLFVRDHLSDYLAATADLELLATCANGEQLVAQVQQRPPDVVLMDIQMPLMDGPQATRAVCALAPSVRVIALTSFGDDSAVAAMLEAGAVGFLLKSTKPEGVFEAIRAAHHGLAVIPPDVARRWSATHHRPQAPQLTDREQQLLGLLAQGMTNKQIGQALFVSASTAKQGVHELMGKLGATSRTAVVARAHQLGLL
mgnify:FL=1